MSSRRFSSSKYLSLVSFFYLGQRSGLGMSVFSAHQQYLVRESYIGSTEVPAVNLPAPFILHQYLGHAGHPCKNKGTLNSKVKNKLNHLGNVNRE